MSLSHPCSTRVLARTLFRVASLAALLSACSSSQGEQDESGSQPVSAAASVLTHHNDRARTGANLAETVLTTANVNASHFGKVFERPVNGQIYAQPLYVPGAIGGKNVVYVATAHNSVYAFNADDPTASKALWTAHMGSSAPSSDTSCLDLTPEIGITSTPVIDPKSRTIYVSAKTKEGGKFFYRLHALDIVTGKEKPGSPQVITASLPGTGAGSNGGRITFDPFRELNRPALTLVNGVVYLAFGSLCDFGPYHGWLLGYDAATLKQVSAWAAAPNGSEGGIWMSGNGPAADDSGALYFMTGNGTVDTANGSALGSAFVKVVPGADRSLHTASWFVPGNFATLNNRDLDLGSSGALLLPGTNLVLGGGKEGVLYLLDRANLGSFHAASNPPDPQIVQRFQAAQARIAGSPVFWNGPKGPSVYLWGADSELESYVFDGHRFSAPPVVNPSPIVRGIPGGILSLSASGSSAGTGILWASHSTSDAGHQAAPGILHAYDAADITKELWNSRQVKSRDDFGLFAKFTPPTVAGGKVYMATFSNKLAVYGLLAHPVDAGTVDSAAPDSSVADSSPAVDSGHQPTTWTFVYSTYFAAGTPGHCGNVGCHDQLLRGFQCGADKSTCYTGLINAGLVNPANPAASRLGNPQTTPLAWFGTGGAMPLDEAVSNSQAAAAATGWLQAGAPNN